MIELQKEFYTYEDLAILFGVSKPTLYNYVQDGDLKKHDIGGTRFSREDVMKFIESREDSKKNKS